MVLGIDLGTTYSVAAYIDEMGMPHAICNSEGDTTTPSVVYFEDEKNVVVGQIAKDFMSTEPKKVISTVKNAMGENRTYSPLPNTSFRPQDISSLVLRKLVKDAETFLGNKEQITDVVVTVPAYFTDAQRNATNEAVRLAGLNLLSNVNEPTAAAVFYAHKSQMKETNTLVFDLGGGTFDVTIMHINGADVEVKSTRGLKNVGGSFFDQQLVDYICEKFDDEHDIDLEDEEYIDVYQSLYEKVEKAKKQVCTNKTQTIVPVNAGTEKDRIVITYDYFVGIISKLCDKIENLVKMAVNDAGLTVDSIDQVIMVGGSSRIPYIEERITNLMGKSPLKVVNPDEVVALGAAIQADKLSKNSANNVKDVCSHGLGVVRYSPKEEKKINEVMIPRNTQVPTTTSCAQNYAFAQDDQKLLKVVVTESDYDDVTYAVTIKELQFDLPTGVKRGMKYTISMSVDATQNISVTVAIPDINKEITLDVRSRQEESGKTDDISMEKLELLKGISVA